MLRMHAVASPVSQDDCHDDCRNDSGNRFSKSGTL
jgi:hypothetical protein